MAVNTAPVIQNVTLMVKSIEPQLEAIGVNHQALAK